MLIYLLIYNIIILLCVCVVRGAAVRSAANGRAQRLRLASPTGGVFVTVYQPATPAHPHTTRHQRSPAATTHRRSTKNYTKPPHNHTHEAPETRRPKWKVPSDWSDLYNTCMYLSLYVSNFTYIQPSEDEGGSGNTEDIEHCLLNTRL